MTRQRISWYAAGSWLLLAISPRPADAHLIQTGLGPVYDGITHLAMTPEDLLPVLALALLAGLRGKAHGRRVIVVLPFAWLLAGIAGWMTGPLAFGRVSWLPLLVLGGLVAADFRLPLISTTAIAGVVGLYMGLANGAAGLALGVLMGIAGAAFVVATLIAAFMATRRAAWTRIAARVAGSWIAASGLLLLGWSLR